MKTTSPPRERMAATDSAMSLQILAISASSGGLGLPVSHTLIAWSRSRGLRSISRHITVCRSGRPSDNFHGRR